MTSDLVFSHLGPFYLSVGGISDENFIIAAFPGRGSGVGLVERSLLDGTIHPHGLSLPLRRGTAATTPPLPAEFPAVFHSVLGGDAGNRPHRLRLLHLEIFAQRFMRRRILFFTVRLSLFEDDQFRIQGRHVPPQILI